MIEPISILTVLGLALGLALLITKAWYDSNKSNKKEKDDINKEIDNAHGANSLLRIFDKLRHK